MRSPSSLSLARVAVFALISVNCSGSSPESSEDENGTGSGGSEGGSGGALTGDGGSPGTGGAETGGESATGGTSTGGTDPSGGAPTDGAGGDGSGSGGDATGGSATGGASGVFTLTSAALSNMGEFPDINTCAGNAGNMGFGEAIPLEWSGFPEETMSFALTMIDVTLVDGSNNYLGCHSAFWNVPVTTTSMPVSDWASALGGAMSIRDGYLGPCPNYGGGTNEDTYVFTLYAMGEAALSDADVNEQAFNNITSCNALRDTLEASALASATLTGTSSAVGGN